MIKDLMNGSISQQDILNNYNSNISYRNLPRGIDGFVFNYCGIYNVYINDNLSYYRKKETILHELAHIELNHLEQNTNDLLAFKVSNYEDEADFYINQIKKNIKQIENLEKR